MTEQRQLAVHQPCDKCGSSDALAVYSDGVHCFSCGFRHNTEDLEELETYISSTQVELPKPKLSLEDVRGVYAPIKDRGIDLHTCKLYKVTVKLQDGKPSRHVYNYFDEEGKHVAAKVRKVQDKAFFWVGSKRDSTLFGQQAFGKGSYKRLIITEGEVDAMSARQMLGNKVAAVSIKDGAQSAVNEVKANLKYIESFDEVILCFDADDPGQDAQKAVLKLLTPGKTRVFKHAPDHKDANDYLVKGNTREFSERFWRAELVTPTSIVASSQLRERIKARKLEMSMPYPWKTLNRMTYGIRTGEIVLIGARRGVGKSNMLREIIYNVLDKDQEAKVAALFLEETPEEVGLGLMSVHANKPMHLPDTPYTDEEFENAFKAVMSNDRVFFADAEFVNTDIDGLVKQIRYLVKGVGCKYVIIDHLGMITSDHSKGDERKRLDEAITKLKSICKELGIALLCTIHINREGMVRGSDGPENFANVCINLDRDVQADDELVRRTTNIRITKNRYNGQGTGPAGMLRGNERTWRLEEVEEAIDFDDTPVQQKKQEVPKDDPFAEFE